MVSLTTGSGGSIVGSLTEAITFSELTVSALTGPNWPTAALEITINGADFGSQSQSMSAMLGSTSAKNTRWLSDTSTSPLIAAGLGGSRTVALSAVVGVVGSTTEVCSYDGPADVRDGTGRNGPSTGGTTFALSGLDFGFEDYCARIRVGALLKMATASRSS